MCFGPTSSSSTTPVSWPTKAAMAWWRAARTPKVARGGGALENARLRSSSSTSPPATSCGWRCRRARHRGCRSGWASHPPLPLTRARHRWLLLCLGEGRVGHHAATHPQLRPARPQPQRQPPHQRGPPRRLLCLVKPKTEGKKKAPVWQAVAAPPGGEAGRLPPSAFAKKNKYVRCMYVYMNGSDKKEKKECR